MESVIRLLGENVSTKTDRAVQRFINLPDLKHYTPDSDEIKAMNSGIFASNLHHLRQFPDVLRRTADNGYPLAQTAYSDFLEMDGHMQESKKYRILAIKNKYNPLAVSAAHSAPFERAERLENGDEHLGGASEEIRFEGKKETCPVLSAVQRQDMLKGLKTLTPETTVSTEELRDIQTPDSCLNQAIKAAPFQTKKELADKGWPMAQLYTAEALWAAGNNYHTMAQQYISKCLKNKQFSGEKITNMALDFMLNPPPVRAVHPRQGNQGR